MSRKIDLVGHKYNRLTVVSWAGIHTGRTAWNCICDCGNKTLVTGNSLRRGNTMSCGCKSQENLLKRNFRHGFASRSNTAPLYKVFQSIRSRCTISTATHYRLYGGRGIKCLWASFEDFKKDMGNEYEKLYTGVRSITIERVDRNGHYCKENCIWASYQVQANNTSRNHFLEFNGVTKTLSQWAREFGSTQERIRARLKLGFTPEQALTFKRNQYRV